MCVARFCNKKTTFQAINTKSLKSQKIKLFQKGLTHGYGKKNCYFSNFFLQAIKIRKMSFTISQNKKIPFQAIKTRSSKRRKIDIFPKGLTHGIGPKMAVFPNLLLRQYRPVKCILRYSRTKNAFLGYKNKKFKKSKN